jgi:hypothetical protein
VPYQTASPAPAADPYSVPDPVVQQVSAPAFAPTPYVEPRPTDAHTAPSPRMLTAAVPDVTAREQSDLWFLSTEPDGAAESDESDEVAQGKQPSSILTAILTIGMAVLVIVLVLVFIQLMTSLLR